MIDFARPFETKGDLCGGFFKELFEAGRIPIPAIGTLLEIGCAEWDFLTPMKACRPGLYLTGVDQRETDGNHQRYTRLGADRLIYGDIRQPDLFEPASFDVIVAVSVIEHVGIGRYNDPIDERGDSVAMSNCHRWIKPDGVMYLDVPYRPAGLSTPFRQYNERDLRTRVISGWTEVDRQFFESTHPDGPYMALVLKP